MKRNLKFWTRYTFESAEATISTHRSVGILRRPIADTSPGATSQMRAHTAMVIVMISAR